ncbi:MAG: metallopeptidase family protein [Myxococcaceae bacterium]
MRSRRDPHHREAPERGEDPIEALLAQAAEAFESGRANVALALADEALKADGDCAQAMHMRAAALLQLDRAEEAHEAYDLALELDPEDPEILLGYADLMICRPGEDRERLEDGLDAAGRGRKLSKKLKDDELQYEFAILQGIALNQLGECDRAIKALDDALTLRSGSVEAKLERAIALFELCRFKDAKAAFDEVLTTAPDEPWAHHYLGLLAERRKDLKDASKRFSRARELAPEEFPAPSTLDEKDFDAAVEDAVKRVPEHVKKYLENVVISVEEIPSDEDLLSEKPPLSPAILGVFRGTPVGERSVQSAWDHAPASIILYQRNLERFAKSRDELIEQIGITLLHEVGHLVGLDEEDLWERGLD